MGAHLLCQHRIRLSASAATVVAAACLVLVPKASALPQISASHFKSAKTCICHEEQLLDWRTSMHAKALLDPVFRYEKGAANKASDGALGPFCDTCHTPVGTMAGQTSGGKKPTGVSKQGVTCDFCHQVTGTSQPVGNASQTLKADGTKRAQYGDASAPTHDNAASAFHRSGEFCGSCHSLRHPTSGVVLDATYDEWKSSQYAQAGVVCQDCHMALTPAGGPVTGQAAATGPVRSYVYFMTFAGANVALGNAAKARANLESAATVSIQAPDVLERGSTASATITVTNSGAGHAIPGGAAEMRRMWLEVSVVLPDGSKRPLGTSEFGIVYKDAAGHHPAPLWEAAAVYSDERIAPKASATSTFTVAMDTSEPMTIEAALNYQSFGGDVAEAVGVKNPVTLMASAKRVVYGSEGQLRQASRAANGIPPWAPYAALAALAGVVVAAALFLARRVRSRKRRSRVEAPPAGE